MYFESACAYSSIYAQCIYDFNFTQSFLLVDVFDVTEFLIINAEFRRMDHWCVTPNSSSDGTVEYYTFTSLPPHKNMNKITDMVKLSERDTKYCLDQDATPEEQYRVKDEKTVTGMDFGPRSVSQITTSVAKKLTGLSLLTQLTIYSYVRVRSRVGFRIRMEMEKGMTMRMGRGMGMRMGMVLRVLDAVRALVILLSLREVGVMLKLKMKNI